MGWRILMLATFLLVWAPAVHAEQGAMPLIYNEVILEARGGNIIAPRARHAPKDAQRGPEDFEHGWRALKDGDYYGFDPEGLFNKEKGTLEVELVVVDKAALSAIGSGLEALVTLYDKSGTAFFTVGINDHDLTVGSFPLHPMVMDKVFGGTGFPYLGKLDGPLQDGAEIKVTVTWGDRPSDNKVYVNGKRIGLELIKGPRNRGNPPGFEPTATLGSFLEGFRLSDGRTVGPPDTLAVGRVGTVDAANPLSMHPPRAVAIRKVRFSNLVETP